MKRILNSVTKSHVVATLPHFIAFGIVVYLSNGSKNKVFANIPHFIWGELSTIIDLFCQENDFVNVL